MIRSSEIQYSYSDIYSGDRTTPCTCCTSCNDSYSCVRFSRKYHSTSAPPLQISGYSLGSKEPHQPGQSKLSVCNLRLLQREASIVIPTLCTISRGQSVRSPAAQKLYALPVATEKEPLSKETAKKAFDYTSLLFNISIFQVPYFYIFLLSFLQALKTMSLSRSFVMASLNKLQLDIALTIQISAIIMIFFSMDWLLASVLWILVIKLQLNLRLLVQSNAMYCGLLKFKYSIIYTSNISTHSSHSFVMGQILQICPCPCLKAKKKQFSYDVHEQTFQMDDQIQGQALPKSSQNRYDKQFIDPKTDAQSDLGSENKMLPQNWQQNQKVDSENEKVEAQKKYIQEKNRQSQQTMKMEFQSDKQQQKINQSVRENILQAEQKHVKPQKSTNPNILSIKKIKKKYNPDDYRFLNEENQFKVKKIDSIKQQQFNIDGCRNCIFFIFDITANVYIDNTQNCFIFIAPCESTIFVRSCKKLYIVAACKQFRTVDCSDCQFSLYCKSQPVIESSSNMVFAPFDCPMYPSLAKQFSKAKLQIWNNHWSQIHNFTKKEGQKDYFLRRKLAWNLTLDVNQIPWNRALKQAQLQQVQNSIVVPFIKGELSQKQQLEQQQGQQQQIKLTKKALIIFNASISKDNDQIEKVISYKTLNERQFVLLKANCNKFSQMGKDPLVALLIKYNNEQLLQGLQLKTKLLITDEDDIQQKSSTYFMNFGDER